MYPTPNCQVFFKIENSRLYTPEYLKSLRREPTKKGSLNSGKSSKTVFTILIEIGEGFLSSTKELGV